MVKLDVGDTQFWSIEGFMAIRKVDGSLWLRTWKFYPTWDGKGRRGGRFEWVAVASIRTEAVGFAPIIHHEVFA